MPRQARKESDTGIYHVMMRGINHQNRRTQQAQSQTSLNFAEPMEQRVECQVYLNNPE